MRRLFGIGMLALAFAAPPVRGAEKDVIEKSIERGVKGLLALQQGNGAWPSQEGMTALAGVTLLECDIPPTDKAVQKAAEFVRTEAIQTDKVYAVCTAIFFLDRLGESVDVPLLEVLTVRLLSGQVENGGWGYTTPPSPEDEKKRLQEHYRQAKDRKPEPRKGARTVRDLAPEVQRRLLQVRPQPTSAGLTDNSNTQFATLALWVGRRHGVPVDGALALIDARYRSSQHADGGWGYLLEPGSDLSVTTPSMTCAGVLGLSVAHGLTLMTGKPLGPNARAVLDPVRDPNLRGALARLAVSVDHPSSVKKVPPPKLVKNDIYYLWSLERIMVAMDLERLAGKDWYNWGAEALLANQQADGRWSAEYGAGGADTCFALLFLRRANLASDLTAMLKSKTDSSLKAGGTLDKDPKPDPKKPPAETSKPPGDTVPFRPSIELRPTFTQPRSARLAESLLKATSTKQGDILAELRDGKGVEYTEALAGAIPQLAGEGKRKAREALAERLTRMKADTLGRYLQDDDSEIRRAAALASGTREFKDQVPQLIALLTDADQGVVLAAHAALKAMTGEKIGPTPEPWRAWWKQQEKK